MDTFNTLPAGLSMATCMASPPTRNFTVRLPAPCHFSFFSANSKLRTCDYTYLLCNYDTNKQKVVIKNQINILLSKMYIYMLRQVVKNHKPS